MRRTQRAITLLELLVVLAILGLLVTLAYSVYSSHVLRARIVATEAEIHELELACEQYRIDTGEYPPSSSGTQLAPGPIDPVNVPGEGAIGCGYMIVALTGSLSGDPFNPIDPSWRGPYITIDRSRLGTITGQRIDPTAPTALASPQIQLLDRFGMPYYYVRSPDYATYLGTRIPAGAPFATDIWYNPSTVQIVSFGQNMTTPPRPQLGLDFDDITNW